MITRFRAFIHAVLQRHRIESDMDDELLFHIEAYTRDLERSGILLHASAGGGIVQSSRRIRGMLVAVQLALALHDVLDPRRLEFADDNREPLPVLLNRRTA